jgi:hypothetical protein
VNEWATRHLDAEGRILVHVGGRRELGAHLAPVGIQFVRDQHRQRRVHALAEFETVDHHGHRVVRRHAQEGVRGIDGGLGRIRGTGEAPAGRQHEAQHEATSRKRAGFQEAAPGDADRRHVLHLFE